MPEFKPTPEHQALIDAANRFRLGGEGYAIPKHLMEASDLLTAVDIILKNEEDRNETTVSAHKVLRIASNMIWQVAYFLEGEYDYKGSFEVQTLPAESGSLWTV